jgi:hypothetical protein
MKSKIILAVMSLGLMFSFGFTNQWETDFRNAAANADVNRMLEAIYDCIQETDGVVTDKKFEDLRKLWNIASAQREDFEDDENKKAIINIEIAISDVIFGFASADELRENFSDPNKSNWFRWLKSASEKGNNETVEEILTERPVIVYGSNKWKKLYHLADKLLSQKETTTQEAKIAYVIAKMLSSNMPLSLKYEHLEGFVNTIKNRNIGMFRRYLFFYRKAIDTKEINFLLMIVRSELNKNKEDKILLKIKQILLNAAEGKFEKPQEPEVNVKETVSHNIEAINAFKNLALP